MIVTTLAVQAKVAPIPLETMIKNSDLIVVGRVSLIRELGGVTFADVEISQTLKGDARTEITYSAERTWPCDVSGAASGETAMFFFTKYEIAPSFRRSAEQAVVLKTSVASILNVYDLYRLSSDGRGRMPINTSVGDAMLSVNPGVILPKGLGTSLADIRDYTNSVLTRN